MGRVKWEASQWKDSEELMFDGERGVLQREILVGTLKNKLARDRKPTPDHLVKKRIHGN